MFPADKSSFAYLAGLVNRFRAFVSAWGESFSGLAGVVLVGVVLGLPGVLGGKLGVGLDGVFQVDR